MSLYKKEVSWDLWVKKNFIGISFNQSFYYFFMLITLHPHDEIREALIVQKSWSTLFEIQVDTFWVFCITYIIVSICIASSQTLVYKVEFYLL